jgi:hypothetical protein
MEYCGYIMAEAAAIVYMLVLAIAEIKQKRKNVFHV